MRLSSVALDAAVVVADPLPLPLDATRLAPLMAFLRCQIRNQISRPIANRTTSPSFHGATKITLD